jgi:penicillin-binding protein 2
LASTTTARPSRRVPKTETVVEPYRLTPRIVFRLGVLSALLLIVFAALFLRLWALQVLAGTKYVDQAQANSYRSVRVPAQRGLIFDRNGVPLVTNVPATAVELWPSDLPNVYTARYAELKRLAQVTRVPLYEIASGIKQRRVAGDPLTPVTVREAASKPMATFLAEHASEFPGVTTQRTYVRHYPYQALASQVLGYVGSITQDELRKLGKGYDLNDELGQAGVESKYDSYLRGVNGDERLYLDSLGRPRR